MIDLALGVALVALESARRSELARSMASAMHAASSVSLLWLPWKLNAAERFFLMLVLLLPIGLALLERVL